MHRRQTQAKCPDFGWRRLGLSVRHPEANLSRDARATVS